MNCIFICIFNSDCIKLLYLLLESIYIYGNIGNDTNILIYTTTAFMNIIKKSNLYTETIKFAINDSYNDLDTACRARLDLFNLPTVSDYNKILYLDSDILIKDDLTNIFNVITEDILYVLEEGNIEDDNNFWGKDLFGDEINNYPNKTAFTTDILLFNNCEKIKNLFSTIKQDMNTIRCSSGFYDQPYIVYNAFKYNLYDNKKLNLLVANNDLNIYSDKILHHFPGCPGMYEHKYSQMQDFLNGLKDQTINKNIETTKTFIDQNLLPIIKFINEPLEGNIFMIHNTTIYTDAFLNKTKNICNLVLNKNIKNAIEVGFNSGFSTLLMLISNPHIIVHCIDLGIHSYTIPCYEKIKEVFGDRIQIALGDSRFILPMIHNKYDLIHIDGGHETEVAESDIVNAYRLSKNKTIIIMDDYDFGNLHALWDNYVNLYGLKNLDINIYDSPQHSIKYVDV